MSSIPSHSESGGHSGQSEEISKLREDVASLKDTIARIASQASSDAAKTVRNLAQSAASQVGGPPAEWQIPDPNLPHRPSSTPKLSHPSSKPWQDAIHWARSPVHC